MPLSQQKCEHPEHWVAVAQMQAMAGMLQRPVSGGAEDTPEKLYSIFLDFSSGYLGICFRN